MQIDRRNKSIAHNCIFCQLSYQQMARETHYCVHYAKYHHKEIKKNIIKTVAFVISSFMIKKRSFFAMLDCDVPIY